MTSLTLTCVPWEGGLTATTTATTTTETTATANHPEAAGAAPVVRGGTSATGAVPAVATTPVAPPAVGHAAPAVPMVVVPGCPEVVLPPVTEGALVGSRRPGAASVGHPRNPETGDLPDQGARFPAGLRRRAPLRPGRRRARHWIVVVRRVPAPAGPLQQTLGGARIRAGRARAEREGGRTPRGKTVIPYHPVVAPRGKTATPNPAGTEMEAAAGDATEVDSATAGTGMEAATEAEAGTAGIGMESATEVVTEVDSATAGTGMEAATEAEAATAGTGMEAATEDAT
eukprot:Hpha_TRINITY_DN15122_c1_g1::TRINITY_DN15122_c1_g1_i10::g.129607::m.129607